MKRMVPQVAARKGGTASGATRNSTGMRDARQAPEPDAGAGLSGAPPTETGPAGLGSGGRVGGRTGGNTFRDAWTTRVRGFGRGILEVVDSGMLEVVSGGVTGFCREFTCADSKES